MNPSEKVLPCLVGGRSILYLPALIEFKIIDAVLCGREVLPSRQPIANDQNKSIAVQTLTYRARPATQTESKKPTFPSYSTCKEIFLFWNSIFKPTATLAPAWMLSWTLQTLSFFLILFSLSVTYFFRSDHSIHFTVSLEVWLNHTFFYGFTEIQKCF